MVKKLLLLAIVTVLSVPAFAFAAVGDYMDFSFNTTSDGGLMIYNNYIYDVDESNRMIEIYDDTGSLIDTIGELSSSGNSSPVDITTDGTYIYITDNSDNEIYKYNLDGTYTGLHFDTASTGSTYLYGIVYDGQYLLTSDLKDYNIYKWSTIGDAFGVIVNVKDECNIKPMGITFDGVNIWVSDMYYGISQNICSINYDTLTFNFSFITSDNTFAKFITWNDGVFWIAQSLISNIVKYEAPSCTVDMPWIGLSCGGGEGTSTPQVINPGAMLFF
jgi:hypothetical protein